MTEKKKFEQMSPEELERIYARICELAEIATKAFGMIVSSVFASVSNVEALYPCFDKKAGRRKRYQRAYAKRRFRKRRR